MTMSTYYVSPSGSDAAAGQSAGTAWASIGKVNSAVLGPGDVVLFERGGTWTGTALTVAGSGSAGSPILISAYGSGPLPIIDGGGSDTTAGTVNCIVVTGSHVTVENVQVQHALSDGIQVQGNNFEARFFVARNNPIGVNTFPGQVGALLHHFQCIDNNVVIAGPGADDDYGAMGISLSGDAAEVHHFTISGSLTFASPDYGTDGSAIEVFGGTNTLIRDGVAVGCETFSELGHGDTDNVTYRNIVYRSSFVNGYGFVLQGSDGPFGPVTNVVVENCSLRLSGSNGHGLVVAADATCRFRNNVVEAAYLGFTANPQDEERNVWFGGGNGNDVLSTHHATQSGLAPTDVVADPLWTDPEAGDLHLAAGSPAIGLGVPVGWTTDLDGNPRTVGTAPDAGAYEWQVGAVHVFDSGALMSIYTVPAGHIGVHSKTLTASMVDTVTFTGVDLDEVEILTDGTEDIFVSFGATTTPTVAGTMCYRVPAGSVSAVFTPRTSGDTVVKLISAGTPTYSVSRA